MFFVDLALKEWSVSHLSSRLCLGCMFGSLEPWEGAFLGLFIRGLPAPAHPAQPSPSPTLLNIIYQPAFLPLFNAHFLLSFPFYSRDLTEQTALRHHWDRDTGQYTSGNSNWQKPLPSAIAKVAWCSKTPAHSPGLQRKVLDPLCREGSAWGAESFGRVEINTQVKAFFICLTRSHYIVKQDCWVHKKQLRYSWWELGQEVRTYFFPLRLIPLMLGCQAKFSLGWKWGPKRISSWKLWRKMAPHTALPGLVVGERGLSNNLTYLLCRESLS